ncbi:MAG TPA: CHAD domain-containing protein [Gammaproteobacteria bacterium]
MAYRFKSRKNLEQELRRIACQQLERASAELTDPELDPAKAVHQARKRLKKLRSLLRLVRPALDREVYKGWNRRFRDLGRSLASARDADVLLRTLDELEEAMRVDAAAPDLSVLRRILAAGSGQEAGEDSQDLNTRMAAVAEDLRAAHQEMIHLSIDGERFEALGAGLQRTHARGRKALRKTRKSPTDARFHAWRKRVKDHWYHSRLLVDVWPGLMKPYAKEMKRLSDLLGDDHDLAMFHQRLRELPGGTLPEPVVEALQRSIEHRRDVLRSEAYRVGDRVYAEKSKRFRKRIESWWEIRRVE